MISTLYASAFACTLPQFLQRSLAASEEEACIIAGALGARGIVIPRQLVDLPITIVDDSPTLTAAHVALLEAAIAAATWLATMLSDTSDVVAAREAESRPPAGQAHDVRDVSPAAVQASLRVTRYVDDVLISWHSLASAWLEVSAWRAYCDADVGRSRAPMTPPDVMRRAPRTPSTPPQPRKRRRRIVVTTTSEIP